MSDIRLRHLSVSWLRPFGFIQIYATSPNASTRNLFFSLEICPAFFLSPHFISSNSDVEVLSYPIFIYPFFENVGFFSDHRCGSLRVISSNMEIVYLKRETGDVDLRKISRVGYD